MAELVVDESFRAGADAIPAIVCVFSTTAELTFANKFFRDSTGWPASRLRDFGRLVHPLDRERTLEAMRAAVAKSSDYRGEFRFRFPDGAYRTFFCTAAPLLAEGGAVRGLYGIAIDIEDRVQTRNALINSERRLDTFLTTVPQIVWTADPSGTIDWYNDRWYDYTGQTHEEAAGWGWQAVHHPDDFPRVMEEWPRCIATGDTFEMEFRLLGRDGYRWFLTRITPLRDDRGNIIRWFGANTDIDDRKRSEQRLVGILQEVFRNERAPQIEPLQIDALYLPAEPQALVGGDWYDAFALADGRCLISIGDVAGHGIEAASAAARLRQTVAAFALEDPDPARVLERTNRVCAAQKCGACDGVRRRDRSENARGRLRDGRSSFTDLRVAGARGDDRRIRRRAAGLARFRRRDDAPYDDGERTHTLYFTPTDSPNIRVSRSKANGA